MNQLLNVAPHGFVAALLIAASCSSGGSGDRTVSGAFEVTHWLDDGSRTTVREALPHRTVLKAIHIPDTSATGYTSRAASVDANQAFSLGNVPAGSYFVQLDTPTFPCCSGGLPVEAVDTLLIEQRADAPDFGRVTAGRADLAMYDFGTPGPQGRLQAFNLSGLDPWAPGDGVLVASAQGLSYSQVLFSPAPAAGATTYAGANWTIPDGRGPGLPDSSKSDSVYIYQRSIQTAGTGDAAADVRVATRSVRKTDLTAVPGGTTIVDVALGAVPQTGRIQVDARYSQFGALRAQVHPSAVPSAIFPAVSIQAVPRSVTYPEMPFPFSSEETSLFLLASRSAIERDVDYGTLPYGEFLDSGWKTYRNVFYGFDVDVPTPGAVKLPFPIVGAIRSSVPLSDAAGPIIPALGPPTAPRIEGRDAFSPQSSVGLQPTLSWSPPTLGSATSYQLEITNLSAPVAGEVQVLTVVLYSGTQFRIPPGFLRPGALYSTIITARSAPWDVGDHPPFRTGVPLHTADCVLGAFVP